MPKEFEEYIQLANNLIPLVNTLVVIVDQLITTIDGLKGDDAAVTQHIQDLKPTIATLVAKVNAYQPVPYGGTAPPKV